MVPRLQSCTDGCICRFMLVVVVIVVVVVIIFTQPLHSGKI